MYAGPRTYEVDRKDLFSFGRLAMELLLKQEGKMNTFRNFQARTFCLFFKEWLFLTFFPQENSGRLADHRSQLTPFLNGVAKALSIELEEEDLSLDQKAAIFNEIAQNIPAENSTLKFFTDSSYASETLQNEFDQLLNLQ